MPGSDWAVADALAEAGVNEGVRTAIFEALRQGESEALDPLVFRNRIRWPIIQTLLDKAGTHRVTLNTGMVFEVAPDSRIERALLLSPVIHPDHVWEPQTTKLLTTLGKEAENVIVGGAYIGDQALLVARAMKPGEFVHAFEPMDVPFTRLLRNIELNHIANVHAHKMCLWDTSGVTLRLEGEAALASSVPVGPMQDSETAQSISINDYVSSKQLGRVGLIMIDTEGGEQKALAGSSNLLSRPFPEAPHVVFEVHRNFVDWSDGLDNTPIVRLMTSHGYTLFAIRDFQDNYPMGNKPIEVIPAQHVYLKGPPHGFNLLATKDDALVQHLGLRVVEHVSPKLLVDRDPALHHPLDGL